MKLIKKILRFFLLDIVEKQIQKQENKTKSKLELCEKWVEELLLSTDIELENVYVHKLGNWGLCGKSSYGQTFKKLNDGTEKWFDIIHSDKAYIFVPEIKDTWTVHAWIHEIGHYQLGHYKDKNKPTYIKEYEAEQYSIEKATECPHIDDFMMVDVEVGARWYVWSHVLKAIKKGEINKDTIEPYIKEYLLKSPYIAKEFESECAMSEHEFNKKVA